MVETPSMNSNQNLKHSVFNLYAKPIIPESNQKFQGNIERSMMNLYLDNEDTSQP